jgi:hypothetical protein
VSPWGSPAAAPNQRRPGAASVPPEAAPPKLRLGAASGIAGSSALPAPPWRRLRDRRQQRLLSAGLVPPRCSRQQLLISPRLASHRCPRQRLIISAALAPSQGSPAAAPHQRRPGAASWIAGSSSSPVPPYCTNPRRRCRPKGQTAVGGGRCNFWQMAAIQLFSLGNQAPTPTYFLIITGH